jgi:hypothetical protein
MKKITQRLAINLFAIIVLMGFMSFGQSATYTITFTGTWNSTDHTQGSIMFPTNDHWSDLVGATHNANITFWEADQKASTAIENVAEIGSNSVFNTDVNNAITAGTANQWLQEQFETPNNATSSATLMTITTSEDFPLLTLVSMIAPSPDWFIGINSFSLLDGSNNWKDTISIDMFPYDAGTEEGSNYDTSNPDTTPKENISSLVNMAPFNDKKVGTMAITLESVLSTATYDFKAGIHLSPNPTKGIAFINNATSETIKSIQVFDVIGKLVKTINLNSNNTKTLLNLDNLNAGIYMVKVNSAKGNASIKKLVIE